jgi:hypothetical protein
VLEGDIILVLDKKLFSQFIMLFTACIHLINL